MQSGHTVPIQWARYLWLSPQAETPTFFGPNRTQSNAAFCVFSRCKPKFVSLWAQQVGQIRPEIRFAISSPASKTTLTDEKNDFQTSINKATTQGIQSLFTQQGKRHQNKLNQQWTFQPISHFQYSCLHTYAPGLIVAHEQKSSLPLYSH